jgi:hypothetical protein
MNELESDVNTGLVALREISVGELFALDDSVLADSVRHVLEAGDLTRQESVAPFNSHI